MTPTRVQVFDAPFRAAIEWQCEHGWRMWELRDLGAKGCDITLWTWPEDPHCIACPTCRRDEYLCRVRNGLESLAIAIERRTK